MAHLLEGIRILAVEHWVAVPGATAIMADWGAEVIKVEDPRGGDAARGYQASGLPPVIAKLNPLFEVDNRNKRSIAIDLRRRGSQEIIKKLVQRSDVFISNFIPSVLKRFNLDYQSLSQVNPRLVYVTLTGYGAKGPDKDRPGYDYAAFWARGGPMASLGEPDAPPSPQKPGQGDHTTSLNLVAATLAGLFHRERTGKGQEINVSLYNTAIWTLSIDVQTSLLTGEEIPRISRKTVGNPLFNSYKAKDGKWLQLVCLQSDRYWSGFCKAIGREDLEHDPKFDSAERRRENSKELISIIDEILATKTRDEWGELFDENGVIWGRVQTILEVTQDPQALANEYFVEVDHPLVGPIKLVASPVKFSETPATIRSTAPELGQHTEEVLLELGYSWDDITKFKEEGVIL